MSSLLLLLLIAATGARAQQAADYIIGPQDVLAIQLFDQTDLSGKYTVEADGTFSFPLVGRLKAGGLTLRTFESELKQRLADGYFKDPQLSVAVNSTAASVSTSWGKYEARARFRSRAA